MFEQDRTLEREHSTNGFHKQANLVERTWNDDLRAMSYGLGIAIVVLGVVGTTSMEIKRLRQSRLELTALCLLAALYLWSRMGSSAPISNFRQPVNAERGRRAKGCCRLHGGARGSGAPSGERNGQYRHGERTKAAIAEQRKFGALLKMLRDGLT